MRPFKHIIEKSVFGVCSRAADRIGVRASRVRLYFIYITCMTLGSPLILYLFLAFWVNLKKYIRNGYRTIMD